MITVLLIYMNTIQQLYRLTIHIEVDNIISLLSSTIILFMSNIVNRRKIDKVMFVL